MSSRYVLHYFKIANRGGAIRDAFRLGAIAFENAHVPPAGPERDELAKRVSPMGQWPVLELVDAAGTSRFFTQSNAILAFVGAKAQLVPHDLLDRLAVDEVLNAVEDVYGAFGPTMRIADAAEKIAARQALIAPGGRLHTLLTFLNGRYSGSATGPGPLLGWLSVADLKARHIANWLASGMLDGIEPTWIAATAPAFTSAMEKVNQLVKDRVSDASGI
jgi:glutathione S-transferase